MDFLTSMLDLAKIWGIPIVLVCFYIWRDWKRETGLVRRVEFLEAQNRVTMEQALIASANRTNLLLEVVRDNTKALDKLCSLLDNRPCLMGKVQ